MKKILIAAVLILLFAVVFSLPAKASTNNWCPEYLDSTVGECVTDRVISINLPDPEMWNHEESEDFLKFHAEYVVIATIDIWEWVYPSTPPPAGFPTEKWYIVGKIYFPPENWHLGANISSVHYRFVPFVYLDKRVLETNNYFGGVYAGFGIEEAKTGGVELPVTMIFKWEIPANTIPTIPETIVPKVSEAPIIVNYDPEKPISWLP